MIQNLPAIIQLLVLTFIIVSSASLLDRRERSVPAVFFMFGMISLLLSDIYWIAYDILRPGTRMPFAANEIAECASFLLLSAAISVVFPESQKGHIPEKLFAVLFGAANTALWIGWSGEWLQDIIVGIVFFYFLYTALSGAREAEILSSGWWKVLGIGCTVLVMMQAATFFTEKRVSTLFDRACYILILAGLLLFLILNLRFVKSEYDPCKAFAASMLGTVFSLVSMYMSSGIWYEIALCFSTAMILFMYLAISREVRTG